MLLQIPIDGFDRNFSYLLASEVGKVAAIVDPGDVPRLEGEWNLLGVRLKAVFVTHSHFDHVAGVREIAERYKIPVFVHERARERVDTGHSEVRIVGEGSEIEIGALQIRVMETPGHSDDSICFYIPSEDTLITGDTVFVNGCGRADLAGSDVNALYESIQRLKTLPDETKIYPGHDYGPMPSSTIGWEKETNRYFCAKDFEEFRRLRMK